MINILNWLGHQQNLASFQINASCQGKKANPVAKKINLIFMTCQIMQWYLGMPFSNFQMLIGVLSLNFGLTFLTTCLKIYYNRSQISKKNFKHDCASNKWVCSIENKTKDHFVMLKSSKSTSEHPFCHSSFLYPILGFWIGENIDPFSLSLSVSLTDTHTHTHEHTHRVYQGLRLSLG